MLRSSAALAAATGLLVGAILPASASADPAGPTADLPGTIPVSTTNVQYDVSVSPGRVYYTNQVDNGSGWPTYNVMMRTTGNGSAPITLGPELKIGQSAFAALSGSAGRLIYNGDKLREQTGALSTIPYPASTPPEMSGNRSLLWARVGGVPNMTEERGMYDLRTRVLHSTLENRPWPEGAQDLFGNHHIYVAADRSVWVKDLQTGRSTKYRAAGTTPVWAVSVHGPWLAWVTGCADTEVCSQTLTIRNSATGTTTTLATRGTESLDLSGGYLALDVVPGTQRQLRTVKLGTGTSTVVGTLPPTWHGNPPDNFNAGPRHFDIDDETIGWVDASHRGKLARLGAIVDPAKYLGNVIAPGSFSPNGDGKGDTWTVALPVSKALPTCTVTIYRGTTKVRILSCANTTGMVKVTWDGRTGSGAKLPTGRYTYQVSGRDYDGTWLRSYDGTLTTIWGPIDKTA